MLEKSDFMYLNLESVATNISCYNESLKNSEWKGTTKLSAVNIVLIGMNNYSLRSFVKWLCVCRDATRKDCLYRILMKIFH